MTTKRGGDLGGSPTVRRITLTPIAARIVRNACQMRYGAGRQRKDDTNAVASELIAARYEALRPALPWLVETRRMCVDEAACAALDTAIRALQD